MSPPTPEQVAAWVMGIVSALGGALAWRVKLSKDSTTTKEQASKREWIDQQGEHIRELLIQIANLAAENKEISAEKEELARKNVALEAEQMRLANRLTELSREYGKIKHVLLSLLSGGALSSEQQRNLAESLLNSGFNPLGPPER